MGSRSGIAVTVAAGACGKKEKVGKGQVGKRGWRGGGNRGGGGVGAGRMEEGGGIGRKMELGGREGAGAGTPPPQSFPGAWEIGVRGSQGGGTLGEASQDQLRSHIWKQIASELLGIPGSWLQLATRDHSPPPHVPENSYASRFCRILGG